MEKGQFFQWRWNYKGNCLYKDIKKENFKKDPMRQIIRLTWPLIILFLAITCNAKSFHMFFNTVAVVRSRWFSFSACCKVMWTYKGDVGSASGENWKYPSSSIMSTEASFMMIAMKKLLMSIELVGDNRK